MIQRLRPSSTPAPPSVVSSTGDQLICLILFILTSYFNLVAKGTSNHLMKITSKRRRPKAQIALEKKMAEDREAAIA